jgi:hypothetical protein
MNEKIKQLAEQAGINRVDLHYTEEQPPYTIVSYRGSPDNTDPLAKFAELIVRESALVADREEKNPAGCGWITKTIGDRIKQQFGVEE